METTELPTLTTLRWTKSGGSFYLI